MGTIFNPQSYEFSLLGLPRAIIAFFGLVIPGILYLKNRQNKVYQIYFLAVIPAFCWQFGYAWMMQAKSADVALFWSGIGQIGTYFLPSMIYGVSIFQTRAYKQVPLLIAAVAVSFLLSEFVYHPLFFGGLVKYSWGYYNLHGPLHIIEIVFMALAGFGLFFNLIRDYHATASLPQKKLDWFFMVAFGCAYLGALEFLPGYGYDVRPLGFLAVSVWSLVLLWGIFQYRTLDLETIITQTFSYLLTSLGALLIFVCFTAIVQRFLVGTIDWGEILVSGVALLAIFPLAHICYQKFQKHLGKFFYQQRLHAHETLRDFNEQLKELSNPKLLLQELVFTLRATIGVEKTAVYLKAPDVEAYLLEESSGGEAHEMAVDGADEIISWLKNEKEILNRDQLLDGGSKCPLPAKGIMLLDSLGYELLIPLHINEALTGFLALGKRLNCKPFDVSDIELLGLVGQNAAIAISNAMLFAEVSEKNQSLIKIDHEKAHFLANTSHELKTPLHGILGITEALLDGINGPLNEDQAYYVKLVYDSGRALADLVEKLLHLERMDARKADCEIIRFKLRDIVDMAVPIIEGVLKDRKELHLNVNIPEDLEVCGDVGLIRQVLLNLLGNSAKFTNSGTIELTAWKGNGAIGKRQFMSEDTERYVTIAISDTGIGIKPEDHAVIFQPFQQADSNIKKTFGGTGLGLAIVKKIVELHQGRIWLDSELGKGSTFYFTLPQFTFSVEQKEDASRETYRSNLLSAELAKEARAKHPLTTDRLYQVAKQTPYSLQRKGKGEKILVIDDNEGNISLTCSRLEASGFAPSFARHADDAWKLLVQETFDLVLLDVMLPGTNGYEFCQKMRHHENYRNIPLIMVTAKATLEDKVYGLNIGADDYLSKPFNADELTARVHTLLRMKRIQDDLLQKNRELKTISEITSVINKEIELDRLLLTILDKMMELVKADRGCIFTLEKDSKDVSLRFSRGFRSQKRSAVIKAISHDMLERAIEEGRITVLSDLKAENAANCIEKNGSLICLPLMMRDKVYGCLYLYAHQAGKLHESLLRFLVPIAQQVSHSIYNAGLYDLAITDDLTRLYLKRHFLDTLNHECENAEKNAQKFSLMMADIDHFKLFNDNYGHQMGDTVLVQVAELLQDSCRMSDVAARYGGEEFIVLLRNTDLREAETFAERYRKMVESYRVYHRGKALHLTVSAGVCAFEAPLEITPDEMITLVDFELYRAKATGRNCISSRHAATDLEGYQKSIEFQVDLSNSSKNNARRFT